MKYTPETDLANVFPGSMFQLTEDVVNRMKDSSPSKRDYPRLSRASNGTAPSSLAAEGKPRPTGTAGVVLPLRVTEGARIFPVLPCCERSSLVRLYHSVNISSISDEGAINEAEVFCLSFLAGCLVVCFTFTGSILCMGEGSTAFNSLERSS